MKTPKTLTENESNLLLQQLRNPSPTGKSTRWTLRNRCMALIMLDAGLRVGEMVQLRSDDLFLCGNVVRSIYVRPEIAKRKTGRNVPTTDRLQRSLCDLRDRFWHPQGHLMAHYAFYNSLPGRPITTRQVERIIKNASEICLGRSVTPHMLRHTFATRILAKSNLRVTQELLGHKSVQTTQIYTHPNNQDLCNAIQSLNHKEVTGNSHKT